MTGLELLLTLLLAGEGFVLAYVIRKGMRDNRVAFDAMAELRAIKRKRSLTTSKGNITKAANACALKDATTAALRGEG